MKNISTFFGAATVLCLSWACSAGDSGGNSGGSSGQAGNGAGATGSGGSGTAGTGTGGSSGTGTGGAAGTGTGGNGAGGVGTGGTGTGGNGTGGAGTGGTGTGGTGTGGAGGAGGGGAIGGAGGDECGAGVTPTGEGRCATMLKVGKGTALTIHNFEEPTEDNDYLGLFFADGRAGKWFSAFDMTNGATATMAVEETPPGPPSSTRALHFKGTPPAAGGYGATVGVPLAGCYDASLYQGISFYIKGDVAAGNTAVKFSIHTPVSEPEESGGGCSAADLAAKKCRDHFAARIPLSDQWVRYNIPWSQLSQNCPSNIPTDYNPGAHLLTLSFSVAEKEKGFDFWLDDLSFDVGTETSDNFADIVSKAAFEEMWMRENADGTVTDQRNAFYTYEGLVAATQKWGEFCTTGDAVNRRREAAALLANVAHETDSLALLEETGCENDTTCSQYGGSSPSGQTYHGRGPMQLTWNNNYQDAGTGIGADLINTPELVATDATISFGTAFWFWMLRAGAGSQPPHQGIMTGFGETIRSINGALECGGGNAGAIANRIKHFTRFCYMLGVDPGPNTGC